MSRGYGSTATGFNLAGHTWRSARVIAVDRRIIPLGSIVLVNFKDPAYKKYNGIFTARDVGGAIKGKKIDFFIGDFNNNRESQITKDFGVTKATIIVVGHEF
jgi:3D (Asp-Asp-Asp) domain-containing protein